MIFKYTILYVDNVKSSLEFFHAAFGFDIGFLHEAGDYGELITGDTKIAFSAKSLMRDLGKSPGDAALQDPVFELAFETSDVDASFEKATCAGATPVSKPVDQPWGQRISYVKDPNGFLIEICSPTGV
ncbi:MAG: VOC family protein [Pseudomonadota bacterium]|nr:VOC family protein [Pseudomonadota bacterium]